VERVVEGLGDGSRLAGFFTREVRVGGDRTGFDVITLDGRTGPLSRKGVRGGPRVGRYTVDLEAFEAVGVSALQDEAADAFVVDEIGAMELHSRAFRDAVLLLLDDPRPLLATIRWRPEPFCDAIKARPDVSLVEVTRENREDLVGVVTRELLTAMEDG
jgi:nucleoside-triphosphatase